MTARISISKVILLALGADCPTQQPPTYEYRMIPKQQEKEKVWIFFFSPLGSHDLPWWPWCNRCRRSSSHRRQKDQYQWGLYSYFHGNWSTYWPRDLKRCTTSQFSLRQPDTALGERGQRSCASGRDSSTLWRVVKSTSPPSCPLPLLSVNNKRQSFHCILSLGTSDRHPNVLLASHWPDCAGQRDADLTISSQLETISCSSVFSEPPSFTSWPVACHGIQASGYTGDFQLRQGVGSMLQLWEASREGITSSSNYHLLEMRELGSESDALP